MAEREVGAKTHPDSLGKLPCSRKEVVCVILYRWAVLRQPTQLS